MLLNCDELHPGETLSKLKEYTKGFDPEVRQKKSPGNLSCSPYQFLAVASCSCLALECSRNLLDCSTDSPLLLPGLLVLAPSLNFQTLPSLSDALVHPRSSLPTSLTIFSYLQNPPLLLPGLSLSNYQACSLYLPDSPLLLKKTLILLNSYLLDCPLLHLGMPPFDSVPHLLHLLFPGLYDVYVLLQLLVYIIFV